MRPFANSAIPSPPEPSRLPDMFINFPTPGVWRLHRELSHVPISPGNCSITDKRECRGGPKRGKNYKKLRGPPLRKCVATLDEGEKCGKEVGGENMTKQMLLLNC